MKHTAGINFIGMKVGHEHRHEYDSPDIFDIGIAVHADKTNVMKHTADITYIGMKVAHEHKHEYDSPDIFDIGIAVHVDRTKIMKHTPILILSE